jgi:hypothetical protein
MVGGEDWSRTASRTPEALPQERVSDANDLLGVAAGVRGDHEKEFEAIDGTGEHEVIGDPATGIIFEILEPEQDAGAGCIEGGQSFRDGSIAAGWMRHLRSLDAPFAVGGALKDAGFASGGHGWLIGGLGDLKARGKIRLGDGYVLRTLENGPAATGRDLSRQFVVDAGEGLTERVATGAQELE